MRIEQVHLHKVGPFEDARIVFPPGSDPNLADVYLLTGINGSGKSTVLYAIAGALGAGMGTLGRNWVAERLHDASAYAAVDGGRQRFGVALQAIQSIRSPFHNENLVAFANAPPLNVFRAAHDDVGFPTQAAYFDLSFPTSAQPRFEWAAFAYTGQRAAGHGRVNAIEEPTTSPFAECLSFVQTADVSVLARWIASQKFKELKARAAGRPERAAVFASSVRTIEHVIASVTDDESFAFVISDEDNNVRVRAAGVVVEMSILPDGLRSIVSWVGDLLMRLDRIPWVDDVPVFERSFLLLLDEIEIFLHPAWQRKVLPIVQRALPNAQIIAATHSPFVVASAADARVITLGLKDGRATVDSVEGSQVGVSYSAVLRSIFGISNEFDVGTENLFEKFHEAKTRLLRGEAAARDEVDRLGDDLAQRSEEVRELIGFERRQLEKQLAQRRAP